MAIYASAHRHKTNRYRPQRLAIKVQYKEFYHLSRGGVLHWARKGSQTQNYRYPLERLAVKDQ